MISPTWNRADKHMQLAGVFAGQDYAGKLSLYVMDDSKSASPTFSRIRDPRVVYVHDRGKRKTIGAKRNALISLARERGAEIIVQADDDDLYASNYVSTMVRELDGYDICKLSVFSIVRESDGTKWLWDTRQPEGVHCVVSGSEPVVCAEVDDPSEEQRDFALLGYGFSYCMRASVMDKAKFPDMDRGEDYAFIKAAMANGARVNFIADHPEIVWHTVHPSSTSRSFPQKRLDGPTPAPIRTETPQKLTFKSGESYAIVAMVKNEHSL